MATLCRTIEVSASPERVFCVLSDLRNLSRYMEGIHGFCVLSDEPHGEDARCAYRRRLLWREQYYELAVGGYVDGHSFALSSVKGPPQVERWSLQAREGGGAPGRSHAPWSACVSCWSAACGLPCQVPRHPRPAATDGVATRYAGDPQR